MDTVVNPDIAWALKRFTDSRQSDYKKYAEYVAGDQPMQFATGRFEDAFGKKFEQFAYNRTDAVVDAIADRLQVKGFDAPESLGSVSDLAQEIWDENSLDLHEDDLETEALTSGDSYAIAEQDVVDPSKVHIWPQYAENIRVRYSRSRPGQLDMAARLWVDGDGDKRQLRLNLYYSNRIEKYVSEQRGGHIQLTQGTLFVQYKPEGDRAWPVMLAIDDTVPVFHFANNARVNGYGVSELASVIPIQDALNKALMDLLVGMEFAAFRQRVLLNAALDPDDPDTTAALQKIEVGMNRLMAIDGVVDGHPASIAEFSATDIRQFIQPIDLFDVIISRVSSIPVHYLQMTGNFPSGEALRTAEAPFVAKIERLQRRFGNVINQMMTYAVRLSSSAHRSLPPGVLTTQWSSAMPLSERETLALAAEKQRIGMPFETILREMGKDSAYVEDVLRLQDEENARRVAMFNTGNIDALPSTRVLGAAVNVGGE